MVQHLAGDHTGSLGKARERSQVSAGQKHPLPGELARSQTAGPQSSPNPSVHPKLHAGPHAAPLHPMTPNTHPCNTGGGCRNQFGEDRLFNQV